MPQKVLPQRFCFSKELSQVFHRSTVYSTDCSSKDWLQLSPHCTSQIGLLRKQTETLKSLWRLTVRTFTERINYASTPREGKNIMHSWTGKKKLRYNYHPTKNPWPVSCRVSLWLGNTHLKWNWGMWNICADLVLISDWIKAARKQEFPQVWHILSVAGICRENLQLRAWCCPYFWKQFFLNGIYGYFAHHGFPPIHSRILRTEQNKECLCLCNSFLATCQASVI